jgi:hypothetical protein
MLKLVVATSDEKEMDLDDMEDDGVFDFKQLVGGYRIKKRNPILVKLPGKSHLFQFKYTYLLVGGGPAGPPASPPLSRDGRSHS